MPKLSELKNLRPVAIKWLGHVGESEIIHIIDREGDQAIIRDGTSTVKRNVTRCNRVLFHAYTDSHYHAGDHLCARCGTKENFDKVVDEYQEGARQQAIAWERERQRRAAAARDAWLLREAAIQELALETGLPIAAGQVGHEFKWKGFTFRLTFKEE